MFMQTDSKPFSAMGLPNKVIPEGQDLHAMLKRDLMFNEEESLRPECEKHASVLKIKLPCAGLMVAVDDDDGGIRESDDGCRCRCTTPKAVDQENKFPPPPPRKPKSVPSTKRKFGQRDLLDLSTEIESILRDFVGGKIKKVKK